MSTNQQSIIDKIRNETDTILSDETLASVLMSFPAGLVACADGNIDSQER
jgi:hypothetical protein